MYELSTSFSMLFVSKWAPCHCGMAHAQIVDDGMASRYGGYLYIHNE